MSITKFLSAFKTGLFLLIALAIANRYLESPKCGEVREAFTIYEGEDFRQTHIFHLVFSDSTHLDYRATDTEWYQSPERICVSKKEADLPYGERIITILVLILTIVLIQLYEKNYFSVFSFGRDSDDW